MDPDTLARTHAAKMTPMRAMELNGGHIGSLVTFDWELPHGRTSARVTGELRQIYHTAGDTVVHLCSRSAETREMDEFVLLPGAVVGVER